MGKNFIMQSPTKSPKGWKERRTQEERRTQKEGRKDWRRRWRRTTKEEEN
jgi:hypothetical protein